MPVSLRKLNEIKKKASLFSAARDEAVIRVQSKIKVAMKKLQAVEKELLTEIEAEFRENTFATLLTDIDSGKNYSEEEINSILSEEIPNNFGPSKEALHTLLCEIDKFRAWNDNEETSSFDLIPQNLQCTNVTSETATLSWNRINRACFYEIELKPLSSTVPESIYHSKSPERTIYELKPETEYHVRVRTIVGNNNNTNCTWSDPISLKTLDKFGESIWKECPGYIGQGKRYSVDKQNPRIATKIDDGGNYCYCFVTGNTPLPLNKVTTWSIKILNSRDKNGIGILIGITPSGIDKDVSNGFNRYGWHFHCGDSTLYSGPPLNYNEKAYGPRKGNGQYIHDGESVDVVMNTINGDLSFVVNGVNLGVAFEGIPLDKPLVPCVLLWPQGNSVELVI